MRRLIVEEPYSRSAVWSRRVAWFAVFVTLFSVWLTRSGRVDFATGGVLLVTSVAVTLTACLLALMGFVSVWRHGRRGVRLAVVAFTLSLLILAGPAYVAITGLGLPILNDITTDIDNPPAFSRSSAVLAAREGRVPPEPSPQARQAQRNAYPQVGPLVLDIPAREAFELVRRTLQARGYRILEAIPPGGRSGLGRIDAVDYSLVLRFPDDITVRIRPLADGARIDIRSVSRYGRADFGVNARRITTMIDEMSQAASQPAP